MSLFPEFKLDADEHDTLVRQAVDAGANASDARIMADLMAHAMNEAIAKFEEVCERHPHPGYQIVAKVNGMPWLSMWAKTLSAAIIHTAKNVPGMKLTNDSAGRKLMERMLRED